jgi:hypothetical protein
MTNTFAVSWEPMFYLVQSSNTIRSEKSVVIFDDLSHVDA